MLTLLLKFKINLEEYDVSTYSQHYGPLFHRWLPDGEKDAIVLDTGDPNAELKVWFERLGFKDKDFIEFDYTRREVDPETIPKQAILEAGPLMGLLKIQALSEEESTPLRENKVGDARYVALGKKVVRLIHVPVARFLDVLRTNYGQYWIRGLEKWDSRKESLGRYCSSSLKLNLEWSLDEGETWARFMPDEPTARLTVTMRMDRSFREYLTKDDWQQLAKVSREAYEPSLAAFLLAQAHQFLDQGNLKHALIEGVSALEVALEEFVRQKLDGDNSLAKSIQAFWQLPLPARLIPVVSTLGTARLEDVELAAEAIDMRNKVVHDGWDPPERAQHKLSGFLNTVAALVAGPRFKFPIVNPGNKIMPLEEWEKQDHGC